MSGQPTVIYSAANAQQAYLLKNLLEERGIAARVVNDAIQFAGGELPLGWTAAPRVVVAEGDAAQALRIAEEFERRTDHEPTADEPLREEASTAWDDWPTCPHCGARRSARCGVCGETQTRFMLADVQPAEGGDRVLLYCEACDDHFLPQWYRLCHICGYDYGQGLEIHQPPPLVFGMREWSLLAALLAGVVVFGAYFVWLFRR